VKAVTALRRRARGARRVVGLLRRTHAALLGAVISGAEKRNAKVRHDRPANVLKNRNYPVPGIPNHAEPYCHLYQIIVHVGIQGEFLVPKNTSFSLGDHFTRFIEAQVGRGRYGSASDVIRAGLRLLEEQEAKLASLRSAIFEGEQSSTSTAFDFEGFVVRKRSQESRDP
jgi:antitoxin ParD1/3/4